MQKWQLKKKCKLVMVTDVGYSFKGGVQVSYTTHPADTVVSGEYLLAFETRHNSTMILQGSALYGDAILNITIDDTGRLFLLVTKTASGKTINVELKFI